MRLQAEQPHDLPGDLAHVAGRAEIEPGVPDEPAPQRTDRTSDPGPRPGDDAAAVLDDRRTALHQRLAQRQKRASAFSGVLLGQQVPQRVSGTGTQNDRLLAAPFPNGTKREGRQVTPLNPPPGEQHVESVQEVVTARPVLQSETELLGEALGAVVMVI
ncbi:hypothetical protein ACFQY7_23715 [Actinomadura luteofluorescens]|uniref:hypothetical protein n=1 Tax=Actinomadura luteofluorescens TaxID=46163 RepID=UPI00337B2F32